MTFSSLACHKADLGQGWLPQRSHALLRGERSLEQRASVIPERASWSRSSSALLSETRGSNCLSWAGEGTSAQRREPERHLQVAAESITPSPARQTLSSTLIRRRCPLPAHIPPCTGSLGPFCRRNHTLCLEICHFFFFFMLHCSFNKDTNMQSNATCQRELGRERSDACQSSAGREGLGKGAGDALPARTAPPATPYILSLAHNHRPSSLHLS